MPFLQLNIVGIFSCYFQSIIFHVSFHKRNRNSDVHFFSCYRYGFCKERAQQYKLSYSLPTTNMTCPVPLIGRSTSTDRNVTARKPYCEYNGEDVWTVVIVMNWIIFYCRWHHSYYNNSVYIYHTLVSYRFQWNKYYVKWMWSI